MSTVAESRRVFFVPPTPRPNTAASATPESALETAIEPNEVEPAAPPAEVDVAPAEAAVEAQSALYQSRRDVLMDGLHRLGWEMNKPKAGMFLWAKVPEPWASSMTTMDFAMMLLEKGDVAVSPGSGFGDSGEGFLRLALVENEKRLRQAVRQIGKCLECASPDGS